MSRAQAGDGDDTIIVNGVYSEDMRLSGGAGDDVIKITPLLDSGVFYALSDIQGGAGYDVLEIVALEYAEYRYAASNFESAVLRNPDGDILGRFRQEGTREYYTQYDADNTELWGRQVTVRDSAVDAIWNFKQFEYDDSGVLVSVITAGRRTPYQLQKILYNQTGEIIRTQTIEDNGSYSDKTFDISNV